MHLPSGPGIKEALKLRHTLQNLECALADSVEATTSAGLHRELWLQELNTQANFLMFAEANTASPFEEEALQPGEGSPGHRSCSFSVSPALN